MLYRFCHSTYYWNKTHLVARLIEGCHFLAVCACSRVHAPLSRSSIYGSIDLQILSSLLLPEHLTQATPMMIWRALQGQDRGSGTHSVNVDVIDSVVALSSCLCRRLETRRLLLGRLHKETNPYLQQKLFARSCPSHLSSYAIKKNQHKYKKQLNKLKK